MALVIDHDFEVAAPADRVWSVIVDLDRYPDWNPFVVGCRSTLEVGDPIDMRVKLLPGPARRQRETVFEHEPGRFLSYGLAPSALGGLVSRRFHTVEPLAPDRARYRSHFELEGWLSPLVELLLGRRLRAGFTAMSEGIRRRAESLARG